MNWLKFSIKNSIVTTNNLLCYATLLTNTEDIDYVCINQQNLETRSLCCVKVLP